MAITMLELQLITKYFVMYVGLFVFIFGMIGNILNIIIFISLKTFRKNPCGFCLIIYSIVSCGTLTFNLLSFILYRGFGYNITITSVFWCKIQTTMAQYFNLLMYTSIFLAAIDQCMSTRIHGRQQGISLKVMKYLFLIAFIILALHGIPFFIYWNIQDIPRMNERICAASFDQEIFSKYLSYVYLPILTGFLPILLMSILALIAFRNIRNVANRKKHVIRLRLEQQLTAMVLLKIGFLFITMIPFIIVYIIQLINPIHHDPIQHTQYQLIVTIFTVLYFISFADSFYIFLASSARFRRQLKYVLIDMHLKHWRLNTNINRIHPTSTKEILSITYKL